MYFLGGLRVCMALKVLLCSGNAASPQHWSVLRAMHTSTTLKTISNCSGDCSPSIQCISVERKASCGALGGHFCQQRPWLAMAVLVVVGRWRLMSDQSTVGIVIIVYGSYPFGGKPPKARNFYCGLTNQPTNNQ
jgi:hypothetical protein